MSALHKTWLASLAANCPPCRCGHAADFHHRGKSCTATVDDKMHYCKCESFKASNLIEEEMMAKKARKEKGQGRTPTLAPFVDSSFKIYAKYDGKEREATVLSTGIIKLGEKEFTSPSSAGQAILGKNSKGKPLQVDGWRFWKFNKNGERVELNVLRGSKSPLKAAVAPKREKKAAKPKRASKPRARKPAAQHAPAAPASGDGAVATA